jgi:hypothetical protein
VVSVEKAETVWGKEGAERKVRRRKKEKKEEKN